MGNAIVFAVILALLCYLTTTVDAQRHHRGSVPQRPRNGVSMSVIQIEVFGEGFPFGFSKLCSPPYPFPRWGQPDFLKNVTAEGFKQFCDILTNQNLTKAEMREQLEQWAKDQGSDVYDEFAKYVEEKKRRRENIETNMQQLIADTTKFIEDVKNIMNDMSLTRGEEQEKVMAFARALLIRR
ncbi:hypothetical protein Tcan_14897 [Toxocara canis]|uniref:SXP/RAL-2 family protein Ani s 5-like cation-binding domain-containing protein n=1 Tax=Toxocara canis TaxID=6265 RepID=A0A0B2V6C0_TOXCA|nr:hypothetical protein Tcan_14897 [Toxocara canis]